MNKQLEYLNQFSAFALKEKSVESAFLFGSFARNEQRAHSDIDIAIFVNEAFNAMDFLKKLQALFSSFLGKGILLFDKNKLVLYFIDTPKIEILFSEKLEFFDLYYQGSHIPKELISDSILFDKKGIVLLHLLSFTKAEKSQFEKQKYIDKFLYAFESASTAHKRSDAYQFTYHYNLALHAVIQLYLLDKKMTDFLYLPKKFTSNLLQEDLREEFYNATVHLRKKTLTFANDQKRNLLIFFYATLERMSLLESEILSHKNFCEWIFERDYWWNFRDIAQTNPCIKEDLIFRSCALAIYENNEKVIDLLKQKNIKTIIDLRAPREIESLPYTSDKIDVINYIKIPFDPWEQPQWFQDKNYQGSNASIAYRFFCEACKTQINCLVKTIIENKNNGAILIHCYAGKDRTGIIIALLSLLLETSKDSIYKDYLDSEMDTQKALINILFEEVEKANGIENYLLSCDLSMAEILTLKNILSNARN